jgi:glycosyltransferase involved in cell wall biosynthesis
VADTLYDIIRERSNDYSPLENIYHSVTGGELVCNPLTSARYGPDEITLSASVVIPAWNARDTIEQCLIAIEQSSFNRRYPHLLEVVVVDDGSSDGTWELLEHLRLDLRLKAVQQAHHSQAHALNTGISIAEGDVIISCDADMILTPFSIEELMKRHQILDKVLLIGFRYDIDAHDPRIHPSVLREHLPRFLPMFYGDNRVVFHWPGWPENMCAESNHLKWLGAGKRIWITDGHTPDGDSWDLPRMVYGALFSLPRVDFQRMEGYDERFYGWGWVDTLVGGRALALGNYIVPVYSAVGLHVAHLDRSPHKWQESDINYRLLQSTLRSPFIPGDGRMLAQARKRILRWIDRSPTGTVGAPSDVPASWFDTFDAELTNPDRLGKYLFHLGRYKEAIRAFANVRGSEIDEAWALFNQGRALRAARHYTKAIEVLQESAQRLSNEALPVIELGLALAADGDFVAARASLEQAYRYEPRNQLLSYVLRCPAENHLRRGRRYAAQGYHSLAVRDFEAVLIQEPGNTVAQQERNNSLYKL